LTHMLVHDLKSPLGTVMNSLNMLQELSQADEGDQVSRVLSIGLRASSRMAHMIGSILDISRLEAGQPLTNLGPVSIGALIRSAVELVAPLAHYKRITLSVNLAERLPVIVGDAHMLERVIVNLLDNGLKFTPANGSVSISARVETVDDAPALCVGVRDTGPGVPPSVQHRVFDKFARAQNIPQADGVGLGLSFCRLAVEAHGGHIWVESTSGQGAAFIFSLPLSQPDLAKTSI
jgi:signal transduction histidine kinase